MLEIFLFSIGWLFDDINGFRETSYFILLQSNNYNHILFYFILFSLSRGLPLPLSSLQLLPSYTLQGFINTIVAEA